ncbi:MAG: hypothetical protein EOP43_04750 [Sphingobacteriaceae bacterium]|nr:MAG: hypothetical protein EOP43_04750 [Sphingobacteriaceae bacterium]
MKKNLLFLILTSRIFFASAQDTSKDSSLKSLIKLDLGLQGVGVGYEPRISNKMTIDLAAGVGGGYDISELKLNYKWNLLQPALYFMATPKFYYNRKKRIAKGKAFQNNAGNYFGIRLKYTTGNNASNYNDLVYQAGLINLHWGIQRPVGKKWILNAHAGAGYATNIGGRFGTIYPALELKFSYLFKKATVQ